MGLSKVVPESMSYTPVNKAGDTILGRPPSRSRTTTTKPRLYAITVKYTNP